MMTICMEILLIVGVLFVNIDGVGGFAFEPSVGIYRPKNSVVIHQFAAPSDGDEYDDFYADFDPAEFESFNRGYDSDNKSRRDDGSSRGQHDYTRDADADDSNVDLDAINRKIAERLSMRKTGRFEEADQIRNELLDKYGVLVRDKDKKWRSGCSRSGSGLKWLRAGNADRRDREPERALGPNGHDYVMAIDAGELQCKLSVEEINGLLAERLARKFNRDFQGADEIQAELLQAGIFVDDKKREWRADGRSFGQYEPNEYTLSDLSKMPDDSSQEEIESLIKVRALLKADRLFKQSDRIRDDLIYRFNVFIDDTSLQWSVGNPFPGEKRWDNKFRPFQIAKSSKVPDEIDEIQELLKQRDSARVNRDFKTADGIRNRLEEEFNVYVNDKKREWSVGWTDNRSERKDVVEQKGYTQRGGGFLSAKDLFKVNELLLERRSLKRDRRYDEADAIRNQLSDEFGISIDDRNSEWHMRNAPYTVARNCRTLDEETQQKIQGMVEQRLRARDAKDFETADDIRNDLETNFSVLIDDRLREWYVE